MQVRESETDEWHDVALPTDVAAVVLLNLTSYAGGRDIWGDAGDDASMKAACDDGRLEICALRGPSHLVC